MMLLDKSTVKLLRIKFSIFLMPLFLLALSQATIILPFKTILSFLIIHLLVYPSSNGYNSYIDKDEGSIGGLEKPPAPTKQLFYTTILLDLLAIVLSAMVVNPFFALCVFIYIVASRAYSSREIRLKKYPYLGFLTVVVFQGAFTFYMSYLGITGKLFELNRSGIYLLIGCSFQIAGAYPLTQIYQHKQDLNDGVITLSYKLGYMGTFVFTALMFFMCNVCYFLYFKSVHNEIDFYIIQLFFLPIILFFLFWLKQVYKDRSNADFRNTMRMNTIAAVCMNICFIVLTVLNNL
jgi:1,4-dihydroxy-2-naphthoate octaprenyltransferase